LVSFFGVVLCTFFAFKNYSTVQNNREAIIFAQKTEIKNAPTQNGDMIFELHEGTKVLILDELQSFKKIKIADGKTGWMRTADLKEI
jgi:SH3-like domain-containing protein